MVAARAAAARAGARPLRRARGAGYACARPARALLAGRLLGKPVVLQAEINGELSGEVYYWGTPLARRPWRGLVRGGDAAAATSCCATPVPSSPCRASFAPKCRGGGRARTTGCTCCPTASIPPASARPRARSARRCGPALAWPQDALVLTYTGRLLRGKGLTTLLDGLSRGGARRAARPSLPRGLGSGSGPFGGGRASGRGRGRGSPRPGRLHGPGGQCRRSPARLRRLRVSLGVRGPRPFADRGRRLRPSHRGQPHGGNRRRDRARGLRFPGAAGRRRRPRGRLAPAPGRRGPAASGSAPRGREIACARFDAARSAAAYAASVHGARGTRALGRGAPRGKAGA